MRLNGLAVTGFTIATNKALADQCNDVCASQAGLCDMTKGSWCNEAGHCQNLMVLGTRELCFVSPTQPCSGGKALKCSEAGASVEAHQTASFRRGVIQRLQDDTARRGRGPIRFAPDYEPNKHWGDTGCTIA
jgi:hypothetical protein